ncbi:GNAT family N-acetyltransferase [Acetobacterium woodii]|uniref:N-acetyltransferase domain-containing protein n=1 Tax=Acetobacterium woodii (strain ATCC 29683 / DSM 1030 / JCM 2381 / KCTC 1655 / WB1) TaxID=931626 RepID=H6LGP7_ACEWD|nr:GNAT family N-acetyltransferase [Acetobacterium woodii]AFA48375.1 hypothetical protein Awo_c15930 [Acetobacterium woodii DSM 1030]
MLGAIIGDIVGSRFEFNNHRSKAFDLFTDNCRITDDTIMTLAVASAIMEAEEQLESAAEIGDNNREYYRLVEVLAVKTMQNLGRSYPNYGYGDRFAQWLSSDQPKPYNSFGNGAAMRISPAGFAAKTETEARILSEVITRVSHNHPEGLKGAEATVMAIYMARNGADKQAIRDRINGYFYTLDFTIDGIRDTYRFNETCQETVPQAITAFLESTSFEDAIRTAISVGGDSDTLAAITGAIAEAYYGIPENIKEKALTYLDTNLQAIYEAWQEFKKKRSMNITFRPAKLQEREILFREGYREWPKNRTFEEYCSDNAKEDEYGIRYIMAIDDEILSSVILLELKSIMGKKVYGIGSVLTPQNHTGKGYATTLLRKCLQQIENNDPLIFLYSDINPAFYQRLSFRILPLEFQKVKKSTCMVRCRDENWEALLKSSVALIPDYF